MDFVIHELLRAWEAAVIEMARDGLKECFAEMLGALRRSDRNGFDLTKDFVSPLLEVGSWVELWGGGKLERIISERPKLGP